MAHSIPQREKAQAGLEADTKYSFERIDWPAGWCLVSVPDTLFNETAIPLLVRCGYQPGSLDVEIPGLTHGASWPVAGNSELRMTPHGFRIIEESDTGDRILSVLKLDASTLLAEGSPESLSPWLEPDEGSDRSGTHQIIAAGRYAMATYLHRFDDLARLAIVSGTADHDALLTRARGLVHQSAHQLLDAVLARRTPSVHSASRFPLTPLDKLVSRLRPASPTLPYPWLANEEEEPEWRLIALYPAITALLPTYPDLVAGLIGNLLDTMDEDGRLVVAGGNASPLFHGDTEHPLLVQLVWAFFNQHARWPGEPEHGIHQLERYLNAAAQSSTITAAGVSLWPHETAAWSRIISQSGIGTPLPGRSLPASPDAPEPEAAVYADLLDVHTAETEQRTAADQLLTLLEPGDDQPLDTTHIGMAVRCLEAAESWNPELARSLRSGMIPIAASAWCTSITPRNQRNDGVALDAWCALLAQASRTTPARGAWTRWLNQHRRAVSALGLLMVFAMIAFLLTVQFRTTMPTTVYETQLGLAMQDYQMGRYAEAVEKLREIEARGHARNPINLMALGKTYFRARQYDQAAATFATLAEVTPNLPAGHFNHGLSLFQAGDRDKAVEVFESMSERFAQSHPSLAARAAKAAEISRNYGMRENGDAAADEE